MSLIRRLFPWLIAILILWLLFRRYPLPEVIDAAQEADLLLLVSYILLYFIYISIADSWSLNKNLNCFGAKGPFLKALRLRLASNLAMILNFGIGQGILAYLIRQHYPINFARASSILVFQMLIDLYITISISCLGTFFTQVIIGGHDLAPWIRGLWVALSLLGLAGLYVMRHTNLLERVPWITLRDFFHTFHNSNFKHYIRAMIWRLPLHCAGVTYMYFLALCFGVNIPLEKVIVLLPLTIAIGAIPITPSGLGTVQITAIYLFQGFINGPLITSGDISPAELIFAMSIVFTMSIYILKLISGLIFYRFATNPVNNL